ncbi:hypothetical protein OPT61_g2429 [Boeremia exigua]|uniref:Uncharacterized protein n=1 Tax=Boeremia exigua TaxID=749465 RepID=A0ACC2ILZ6_9PLEO|nr:hypothetical protein OPT61_g2429 [Boeremia exigua]
MFHVGSGFLIAYGYELKNEGVFDAIVDWTFFNNIPLKQVDAPKIQLLVLEPGAAESDITCRLIHVERLWRTRYEALSYCWGDESITRQLHCSGIPLVVHVNLHDALSDLRHPSRERLLWVDRLCINQDDVQEKNKQIACMGAIYSQARQVLIYLGKLEPSVEGAIDSIRRLDQKFKFAYWSLLAYKLMRVVDEDRDKIYWKPIISLLNRPWFQRTWVVQETVLARKAQVVCGNQSITWAKLQRVVQSMILYKGATRLIPDCHLMESALLNVDLMARARNTLHPWIQLPTTSLFHWLFQGKPIFGAVGTDPKLLDLIVKAHSFGCKDPRDKLFGMLGLTRQSISHGYIQPNYTISAEHVYQNFVLWEILHNNNLQVLGITSDKTAGQHLCPSWVPRFDRLDPQESLSGNWCPNKFNASACLPKNVRTSDHDAVLHLKGSIVDTIDTVGKKPFTRPVELQREKPTERLMWYQLSEVNKDMIQEAIGIWLAAARRIQCHSSAPKAQELFDMLDSGTGNQETVPFNYKPRPPPPKWEPFLRTFMFDQNILGSSPSSSEALTSVAAFLLVALRGSLTPRWFRILYSGEVGLAQAPFLSLASSRLFAATETGMIGFVPMRAKKGDLVCILHGASVPFILRQTTGGKFQLVGECYMHGIMYGEALQRADYQDKEIEFALV